MVADSDRALFEGWCGATLLDLDAFPRQRSVHGACSRHCMRAGTALLCLPCFAYSALMRLIFCPCTCGGSIGGFSLTESSDACISTCCKTIDERSPFVNREAVPGLTWVRASPDADVQARTGAVFARFRLRLGQCTAAIDRMRLGDQARNALASLGYEVPRDRASDVDALLQAHGFGCA